MNMPQGRVWGSVRTDIGRKEAGDGLDGRGRGEDHALLAQLRPELGVGKAALTPDVVPRELEDLPRTPDEDDTLAP